MKRDLQNKLITTDLFQGIRPKPYPEKYIDLEIWWNVKRINFLTDKSNEIFGEEYQSGIFNFRYVDKEGNEKEYYDLNDLSEQEAKFISSLDLKSNCFGHVFFDGLAWLDPFPKNENIQMILEDDQYVRIEEPKKHCIALFSLNGRYRHVAKYKENGLWEAKMGIYCVVIKDFNYHLAKYDKYEFLLKSN